VAAFEAAELGLELSSLICCVFFGYFELKILGGLA